MPRSEALALIAVGALCVIGIIVLSAIRVAIPSALADLAFVTVSAGAGATLPARTVVTTVNPPP